MVGNTNYGYQHVVPRLQGRINSDVHGGERHNRGRITLGGEFRTPLIISHKRAQPLGITVVMVRFTRSPMHTDETCTRSTCKIVHAESRLSRHARVLKDMPIQPGIPHLGHIRGAAKMQIVGRYPFADTLGFSETHRRHNALWGIAKHHNAEPQRRYIPEPPPQHHPRLTEDPLEAEQGRWGDYQHWWVWYSNRAHSSSWQWWQRSN